MPFGDVAAAAAQQHPSPPDLSPIELGSLEAPLPPAPIAVPWPGATASPPPAPPLLTPSAPLHVIHFNDVYEISERDAEPCGGAPRFAHAATRLRAAAAAAGAPSLVLFSGDALSPSLIATMTRGAHMVSVLNALGVGAACLGNHDLDHGVEGFEAVARLHTFPWLVSNAREAAGHGHGRPLGGVTVEAAIVEPGGGWRVGLLGLIEKAWLDTLSTLPPSAVEFEDAAEAAARLAAALRGPGRCNLIIGLTHMRLPNDRRLAAAAAAAGSVDLILGGHDHEYSVDLGAGGSGDPAAVPIVKSGSDFRTLSLVRVSAGTSTGAWAAAPPPALGPSATFLGAVTLPHPRGSTAPLLTLDVTRVEIARAEPPDARMAAIVDGFAEAVGRQLESVIGVARTPLDARFAALRTSETTAGNFVADLMRTSTGADVAILNSGTLRADAVLGPGLLRARDLVALLPMQDSVVLLRMPGRALLAGLENAVSAWPAREGRFAQVSGLRFAFDPSRPPGARVVRASVLVLRRRQRRGAVGGGVRHGDHGAGGVGGKAAVPSAPHVGGDAAAAVGCAPVVGDASLLPAAVDPARPGASDTGPAMSQPSAPRQVLDAAVTATAEPSSLPQPPLRPQLLLPPSPLHHNPAPPRTPASSSSAAPPLPPPSDSEDSDGEGGAQEEGEGTGGDEEGVEGGPDTAHDAVASNAAAAATPHPEASPRRPPAHAALVAAVLRPSARTPALFNFSTGRTRHGYMSHSDESAAGAAGGVADASVEVDEALRGAHPHDVDAVPSHPPRLSTSTPHATVMASDATPVKAAATGAPQVEDGAAAVPAAQPAPPPPRHSTDERSAPAAPTATSTSTCTPPRHSASAVCRPTVTATAAADAPAAATEPAPSPPGDSGLRLVAIPGLGLAFHTPHAGPATPSRTANSNNFNLRRAESAPADLDEPLRGGGAGGGAWTGLAPEADAAPATPTPPALRPSTSSPAGMGEAGGGMAGGGHALQLQLATAAAGDAPSALRGHHLPMPAPSDYLVTEPPHPHPLPDPSDYLVSPASGAVRRRPSVDAHHVHHLQLLGGGAPPSPHTHGHPLVGGEEGPGFRVHGAGGSGAHSPGAAVDPAARRVGGGPRSGSWVPLDDETLYTVATKSYLARGRDGYAAFSGPDVTMLASEEEGPILPLLVRNHFRILAALSALPDAGARAAVGGDPMDPNHPLSPAAAGSRTRPRTQGLRRVPWPAAVDGAGGDAAPLRVDSRRQLAAPAAAAPDPQRRTLLAVAPALDGRIDIVGHPAWSPVTAAAAAPPAAPAAAAAVQTV